MRFLLIPTRGTRTPSQHVYVDSQDEAEYLAERQAAELRMPVLLCSTPEGGTVRRVGVFGEAEEAPKVKRR